MKIIPLFQSEENQIKKAQRNDRAAEKWLFEKYSPLMLSICRNYIKDLHYAEDVMITGFTRVFDNLSKFRFEGSFEGWVRKIMVREAISFIRSRKEIYFSEIDQAEYKITAEESDLDLEQLQWLIDALPDGYRTVFLMYAVDGYSHKEIAETLEISESTSKSQLFKARKAIQQQLNDLKAKEHGRI